METRTLKDGYEIPAIGYGTYPMRGERAVTAIKEAVRVGYRLIDSAFNYDNEAAVGRAVAQCDVPREELFVTSKLPGRYHERTFSDDAIRESLWRLGTDYIDLYLIHWPNPSQDHYVGAWEALIEAQGEGLIRSIGVSNFTVQHLERLQKETGVLPVANQVELHPYFPQTELLAAHKELGVQTISWSPLGKKSYPGEESVIKEIAAAHGVTPTQVILRWQIQVGSIPIPKTKTPSRMVENISIFDFALTDAEVEAVTNLGRPDGRLFDGDPNYYEEM